MSTRINSQILRVSSACLFFAISSWLCAQSLPLVSDVELQPLAAHAERVVQALELAGSPLAEDQQAALAHALASDDEAAAVETIQRILDPLCLVGVTINPESRVKVQDGAGAAGTDGARLAHVSRQGPQSSRRDGAVALHQPECRADA